MKELFAQCGDITNEERLQWFRDAKFGMFIHWGVYAQLAGSWQGAEIPGIGEQIMRFAKIPAAEYRKIPASFNPVEFDADEWVRIAKDAGMRYIVITAKHHDGFAMYHSHCSPYNIVDATPYGRDPMKALAAACQEHGVRLCFYYSHYQDWDDPNGVVKGETWDSTYPEDQKIFEEYMNTKALPQLTELLTQYGPVGILWYDTPGDLSHYNAKRFTDIVHAIQPACIVGPRVSNDELGDYIGYGDNQVPSSANPLPWETCATMNDTWGFKAQDHNWKPTATLIRLLCSIASKGGNYLLNVGPTSAGRIPPESIERLHSIGEWLRRNGESVYGTSGCVLRTEADWGAMTYKSGTLYLHLFDWPGDAAFELCGLKNKVLSARVLATGEALAFAQSRSENPAIECLTLTLPTAAPDEAVSVLALEIEGAPELDETPTMRRGLLTLPAAAATITRAAGDPTASLNKAGILENWSCCADEAAWRVKIAKEGDYAVEMRTLSEKYAAQNLDKDWEGGHEFLLTGGESELRFTVTDDGRSFPRDLFHWQSIATHCGTLHLKQGDYALTLRPLSLCFEKGLGPKLAGLTLKRIQN